MQNSINIIANVSLSNRSHQSTVEHVQWAKVGEIFGLNVTLKQWCKLSGQLRRSPGPWSIEREIVFTLLLIWIFEFLIFLEKEILVQMFWLNIIFNSQAFFGGILSHFCFEAFNGSRVGLSFTSYRFSWFILFEG